MCFPPTADFSFSPSSGKKKKTDFQFTDLSSTTVLCPLTWSWNFGDGAGASSTSTVQNPIHQYQSQGVYTITLVRLQLRWQRHAHADRDGDPVTRRPRDPRGQGLVEFAIAITIFLTLLIGIVDLARGVYTFNGVAEAAREITRETSVHLGTGSPGASPESAAMVATQRGLVPGLSVTSYTCVDLSGATVTQHLPAGRLGPRRRAGPVPARPSLLGGLRPDHPHLGQQRGDPMMRTGSMRRRQLGRGRRTDGQILVIFALSLVVLISMTGLALDGGSTFSQRRDQQTSSDLAALAGANDYLINHSSSQAIDRAKSIASSNGFTGGVDGVTVTVTVDTSNGVSVSVVIDKPHRNSFLAIVGMPTWQVTTNASALAGFPDSAAGAGPFIFSIGAFDNDGTPRYQTATDFGEGNGDVPVSDLDFAWTNFGTGNVNTSEVSDIIDGTTTINKTLAYGEYIGQHNNGNHTALYGDVDNVPERPRCPGRRRRLERQLHGLGDVPRQQRDGGSSKHINGYFISSFESARLTVASCSSNACPRYLGSYVLKLSD